MTMDRRGFLHGMAATAAGFDLLSGSVGATAELSPLPQEKPAQKGVSGAVSVEGHTLILQFKTTAATWKVYEDLRTREGALVFVSSNGEKRQLTKSAEASMPEGTPYLGLALKEIGLAAEDLLADRLLRGGDPEPEAVRSAAPPMASAEKNWASPPAPNTWT